MLWFKSRKEIKPVIKPEDVFSALLDIRRYKRVFVELQSRARKDKHRKFSYANHPELTLQWILSHEQLVICWILKRIKNSRRNPPTPFTKGGFKVNPAQESIFKIDKKKRKLYRLEWPDRIVQMVFAEILSELWEPIFPETLFSFRKGRSVWQAIGSAVKFVRKKPDETLFVIKRDVKSYGDSISHKILFQQVEKRLAGVDPFVFELLKQFIEFNFVGIDGENHKKEVGLPTGMSLNSVLENLFLLSIDEAMEKINNLNYMRYGDDIWVASRDFKTILEAKNKIDKICSELGLKWNEEKCGEYVLVTEDRRRRAEDREQKRRQMDENNCPFSVLCPPSSGFKQTTSITHLGVSILRDGRVVIPAEKLKIWRKDLKLILRRADYRSRMMDFNKRERLRQLIHFANKFFSDQNLRFKKIDYLLTVVTKDEYFIELDRWVAQVILSVLYGKFTKANFRKTPFKVLKEEGLESLYVRRRRMWMRKSNHRGTETQSKN